MVKTFGNFDDFPIDKNINIKIFKETRKAILTNSYNKSFDKVWIPKSCFRLIKII